MAWICLLSKDDGYRYTFANVGGPPQSDISIPNISRRGQLFEPVMVSVPTLVHGDQ
jgi:hypothetical protein